jgi:hypothetical protein
VIPLDSAGYFELLVTIMGYTKLHATIIHSSIWLESAETRVVWVTMMAMADADGVVQASVGGLAKASNVTREACQTALTCLLGPDSDSRDGTTGERIEVVPGGWLLLNHANYRDKQTRQQEQVAARVRRHRERRAGESETEVTGNEVTPGNTGKPSSASASASAEGESTREGEFAQFWKAFSFTVARPNAERAWKKIKPDAELAKKIIEAAGAYAAATPDKTFRKHPATWLNAKGWEDELPAARGLNGKSLRPVTHIQNMPLGTQSCGCTDCVAFRSREAQ